MSSAPASIPSDPSEVRVRGTVKWFRASTVPQSNFGFLIQANGPEIFVHGKNVDPEHFPLNEGDEVEFCVKAGRDGRPTAGDVRKVKKVFPATIKLPK